MAKKARKKKRHKDQRRRIGEPPGTLVAEADAQPTQLRAFVYDEAELVESTGPEALEGALAGLGDKRVHWLDVVGLGSSELIKEVGEGFGLHPLALEDAMNPHQRPKIEEYGETLFIVTRVAREREGALDVEQVSLFLGAGFVVTFQEREGDAYEPVRTRLRESKGRIRRQDASYLAYALLDASVDAMFPLLEVYDQRLEELERRVFREPSPGLAEEIHEIDRDLMQVRRAVLPMREALSRLVRDEHPLIEAEVRIYLRDCQDHLSQMVDLLTGQRELTSSLNEGHLASLGHRSNEVMKVLTIIATVFIPLSFIAGLYGMNFDPHVSPYNMPELSWAFGYPAALGLMGLVGGGMLIYFRRRGWL